MLNKEKLVNAEDYMLEADGAYINMLKEGKYKEVLDIMSKNREFSFRNCMLIHLQNPLTKKVMTVPQWKEVGKKVKCGAPPILIYKTLYDPYLDRGDKNAKGKGVEVLSTGIFQRVFVYDISNTFGAVKKLDYEFKDIENHFESIKDAIPSCVKGFSFVYESNISNGGTGIVNKHEKVVYLKDSLDKKTLFHTLIQTTAIALSKTCDRRNVPCLRLEEIKELYSIEASAVNYIIAKRFGVEPPKIYEINLKNRGDNFMRAMLYDLAYIRKMANRLTDRIINAINYDLSLIKQDVPPLVKAIEDKEKEEKIEIKSNVDSMNQNSLEDKEKV